ncbi:MBL fold metallo-hydrolase [Candidatus Parcubacteria bacterium]|nr:MAG: MBL fold metallo-hydrolase [Candidatus Parcubacteria bacterium]
MTEENNKIKIHFYGGVEEVTGSNYLVEVPGERGSFKLLVDCGLFQGTKVSEEKNNEDFPYEPASIDALLVTHAHLDHIGRIPKLIREGFNGKIYSTPPTKDFAKLMLIDSIGVLSKEAKRNGKAGPIYDESDVEKAMTLWETRNYRQPFALGDIEIVFRDAGHILGSAMIEMKLMSSQSSGFEADQFASLTAGAGSKGHKKILFSGDLGNSPEPLLNPTEEISDADLMVIESTYGERLHEDVSEADNKLERMIEDVARTKGVLMIPAFSLERTQRILYQINNLVENGRIPRLPIYLDSPLSIKATAVYKNYLNLYNDEARNSVLAGDDLFNFPGLVQTLQTEDSKKISDSVSPKVIIAGAGMCNGGRILHHLKHYLPKENSVLLLVSYQAAGSLGRQLQDGAKLVTIMGEKVAVGAKVEKIWGYSSHADLNGLLQFASKSADTLKKVFVTHGELKSSSFFSQRLRDYMGINAVIPKIGESFEIPL